jgi:ribosome recycling factor
MDFSELKGMFVEVSTRMDAAVERVRQGHGRRPHRARHGGLLDGVQVEAYGSRMPINQVATLSVPSPP